MDLPIGFDARLLQRGEEQLSMLVIVKDDFPLVAAIHCVAKRAGILNAEPALCAGRLPRHAATVNIRDCPLYAAHHEIVGTSRNAVKPQVWIAVCDYVLVALLKKQLHLRTYSTKSSKS